MKTLVIVLMLVGCGNEPSAYEAKKAKVRLFRQAMGNNLWDKIIIRRIAGVPAVTDPSEQTDKVRQIAQLEEDEQELPEFVEQINKQELPEFIKKISKRGINKRKHVPLKIQKHLDHSIDSPKESLRAKLREREQKLMLGGASMTEARVHLAGGETFFHMLFTMREVAGGDASLLAILNIDAQVYFDMLSELQLPSADQVHEILDAVDRSSKLHKFHKEMMAVTDIEAAIEAGKIYHRIGQSLVTNSEVNASMLSRLARMRSSAERDVNLRTLGQPELQAKSWLKHGKMSGEVLQQMAEHGGGRAKLAERLGLSEAHFQSCIRGGNRRNADIERIIAFLHSLDDTDVLKPFAAQLEESLAMENAIDAGAVISYEVATPISQYPVDKSSTTPSLLSKQRLFSVDESTLQALQNDLRIKRDATRFP